MTPKTGAMHDRTCKAWSDRCSNILTASPVPMIPPAKAHVPKKPNTVFFCCSVNHEDKTFVQFGQQRD